MKLFFMKSLYQEGINKHNKSKRLSGRPESLFNYLGLFRRNMPAMIKPNLTINRPLLLFILVLLLTNCLYKCKMCYITTTGLIIMQWLWIDLQER